MTASVCLIVSAFRSTSCCNSFFLASFSFHAMIWVRQVRMSLLIILLLSLTVSEKRRVDILTSWNLVPSGLYCDAALSSTGSSASSDIDSGSSMMHFTAKCWSRMLKRDVCLHCLIDSSFPNSKKSSPQSKIYLVGDGQWVLGQAGFLLASAYRILVKATSAGHCNQLQCLCILSVAQKSDSLFSSLLNLSW